MRSFLLHPGELPAAWVDQGGNAWWPPLRLCLACVVAFFVLSGLVGAVGATTSTGGGTRPGVGVTLSADERTRLVEAGAGGALLLRLIDDPSAVTDAVGLAVPLATCILLPFFALLLMLAYRRSKPRYLPHLLFSLHVHALLFATMAAAAVPRLIGNALLDAAAGLGALLYTSWYVVAAMQRFYGGSASATLARATVVGLGWGGALVAVAGPMVVALLRAG